MNRQFFVALSLVTATAAWAAQTKTITDTSMSGDNKSGMSYSDRGSFGPYIEFNNLDMDNVTYVYKVHEMPQKINVEGTTIYGATGTLPLKEWFDIFLMVGYQYLGVSHSPRNPSAAYADLAEIADLYEDFGDAPLDSSAIKGHHDIHTALFQFGFDISVPIFTNYNYQLMVKPYAFAGAIVGKTFFSDDTKFLSPVMYGYAYGAGVRVAFHGAYLTAGVRNSHEYFHTYFERKLSKTKDGDEFMLDFDTYVQPFISVGVTLF
ncbi:MAG: hypothetical protein HUK19_02705 [Fibrobacter sp.]|nr:hypothetical protein [Fibrobacter sp.]